MKAKVLAKIISQEMLTEDIASMWAEVPFAEEARAGQFVSFYLNDASKLLPRPISICDINRRLGALRFVYRIVGEGTAQMARLKTGDTIACIGPLGNGFPLEEAAGKRLLLVGGGLGVPPMLGCIRDLYDEPCSKEAGPVRPPLAVSCAIGYRHDTFLLDEFQEQCAVYTATDDGSSGVHGTVVDAMKTITAPVHMIFACGPKPMLRAVVSYAREREIPCFVSMEERMACGVGACLGCVCRTNSEDPHYHTNSRRVCKDGPVFPAEEIAELWEK